MEGKCGWFWWCFKPKKLITLQKKNDSVRMTLHHHNKVENHDYELYLTINDIEHTKTQVKHPQTDGIYERFHKTICRNFIRLPLGREFI